jgi:DNA-binding NtrC family response regulator
VVFCTGEYVTEDLIVFSDAQEPSAPRGRFSLAKTDVNVVKGLLEKHNGNVTRAAAELGVSRVGLYYYLKKKNVDVEGCRKGFGSAGISIRPKRGV